MTSPSSQPPQPNPVIVFWILWFALIAGMVVMQNFAGKGFSGGVDQGEAPLPLLGIAVGAACVSLGVRLLALPRAKDLQQKLVAMIVGMALAESANIIGIFVIGNKYPQTQLGLFVAAVACALCFTPIYAKQPDEASSFGYNK